MEKPFALVGFGEAGSTFAAAAGWTAPVGVWDRLADRRQLATDGGLVTADQADAALAGAGAILSLVTADQALAAVEQCAPLLPSGALWCDLNSVAPGTKRAAAAVAAAHGLRYVDVAVLAPVNPARMAVPLLLAGDAADDAEAMLRSAGFTNVRIVGAQIGRASAIKMIRSVMVKGLEALTAEMMLAAAAAGVTDEVLASLDASEKTLRWAQRAAYNIERMVTHGARRAAEMEESALTLTELGVEPVMTAGTVRRQRELAGRTELLPEAAAADGTEKAGTIRKACTIQKEGRIP